MYNKKAKTRTTKKKELPGTADTPPRPATHPLTQPTLPEDSALGDLQLGVNLGFSLSHGASALESEIPTRGGKPEVGTVDNQKTWVVKLHMFFMFIQNLGNGPILLAVLEAHLLGVCLGSFFFFGGGVMKRKHTYI